MRKKEKVGGKKENKRKERKKEREIRGEGVFDKDFNKIDRVRDEKRE